MNISTKISRRFFLGTGAGATAYALLPGPLRAAEGGGAGGPLDTVAILHTTDLHGNILPTATYDGVTDVGGLARCATRIKQWRRQNPHSMVVDIGDLYQGTAAGYQSRGRIMTRCLNHLDFDAWIVGNHEFDWGIEAVHGAIEHSRMPVLAANTSFDGVESWKEAKRDQAKVFPYIFKELNGYHIAFVGLTTPGMANWFLPELVKGFEAFDPIPVLKATLAEIKPRKPDAIILGTHMGVRPWSTEDDAANRLFGLTKACPEIDAIIAGHTHRDQPNMRVNGIPYTQANYFGIHMGRLDLVFDRDSRKLVHVQPMTSYMDSSVAVDPEIVSLVRDELEEAEAHMDQVAGTLADKLEIRNSPGNPSDLERLIGSSIHAGLAQRDIPVDAVLHGLLFADDGIEPGEKTVRDLWGILPFENFVVTAEVTVEQLKAIMAEVYENPRQLRSLIGLRVITEGRGQNLRVQEIQDKNGERLPEDRRIHLALNSYDSASGGGRYRQMYEMLSQPAAKRTLHDLQTRALMVEYFQNNRPVTLEGLL
ncbi:MAG: bifunctional metallophosphatase/5'-nucleotidase [Verrucomicrobia bacterium]|nr:bifunctional metallophosphatase/5'-nucleotidase [Verrucomicrobiota bacterium]MCH8513900.1 bifunctional metallophosphatase/5'-nucleotidase [Kiritimatiellia bacterium]